MLENKRKNYLRNSQKTLFFTLFLLFLSHCSQQSVQTLTSPDELHKIISLEEIPIKIAETNNLVSPKKENLLLQISYSLIYYDQFLAAEEILSDINPNRLNQSSFIEYTIQSGQVAILNQKDAQALKILDPRNSKKENYFYNASLTEQIKIMELRSRAYFNQSKFVNSAQERLLIGPLLTDRESANKNQDYIWKTLSQIDLNELDKFANKETQQELKGWLELAFLNKAYQNDIDLQNQKLDEWLYQWKDHPAADNLPKTLSLVSRAAKNKPKKIALLLPQSGPHAKSADAIRKGFMLAYFDALQKGSETPNIKIYDTSDEAIEAAIEKAKKQPGIFETISSEQETKLEDGTGEEESDANTLQEQSQSELKEEDNKLSDNNSVEATTEQSNVTTDTSEEDKGFMLIYEQAIQDGAELVIGPLNKKHIATLQQERKMDVPTLALNYSAWEQDAKDMDLYQFGLSPEDELKFVAEQAFLRGHRNALVLTPEGTWGERLSSGFNKAWEDIGGINLGKASYKKNEDPSKVIKELFNIKASEQRARKLKYYANETIHFEPRRRMDIDFIFLIASPNLGRQIIPTFSFHYAGKVPVYSSSYIYGAEFNSKDRDLNKLTFSEIPWLINDTKLGTKSFTKAWPKHDKRYLRLNALGIDAYLLYSRLSILAASPESKLFGNTGELQINDKFQIERRPQLAKFAGSKVILQPNLINDRPAEKLSWDGNF